MMSRVILLSSVAFCIAGCQRETPSVATVPKEPHVLKQEWRAAQSSLLGKTFREVAAILGSQTCGDNQLDPDYPEEIIYTFTHDRMDYRVHFKNEKSVRAFKAKSLGPVLGDNSEPTTEPYSK